VGGIPYINKNEVPQANVTVGDNQKIPNLRKRKKVRRGKIGGRGGRGDNKP
jgi:hypothetical protein